MASLGWGVMMVFAMFGGAMIPLFAMPDWMKAVSNFSPVKWAILSFEGATWRGFSYEELFLPLGIMLLIADEPTAGLDVSVQGEILNLLSGLQERMGLGIMIITHNLNIVRHVANQMAIMYLGRFVEQGETGKVLDQPKHPYTAALLSANPRPDPDAHIERIELSGEVPGLLQRPTGCEFHTRCPHVQEKCRKYFPDSSKTTADRVFSCFYPLN